MLGNMNFIPNDLKISMHVGTGNHQRFIDFNYMKLWVHICVLRCQDFMHSEAVILIQRSIEKEKKNVPDSSKFSNVYANIE
jgi:hypothetical protein